MDKGKRINKDLQNITHKTKDQATHTPLKSVGELRCSRRVSSFCSTTVVLLLNDTNIIRHENRVGHQYT